MAVVIASSNIPEAWNEWAKLIHSWEHDIDTEKNKPDTILGQMFNVSKSSRYGEKHASTTALGDFGVTAEGAAATEDSFEEGFTKLITHTQFMKKLNITAIMKEDNQVAEALDATRQFMASYKRSRVKFATAALCGEGATFTYNSTSFDRTTGDGKALFAIDHPGKKSGVAAQSNVYTDAFSLDMLVKMGNIGRNFKNQSGEAMGYDFDTIIVPGNVPALEETIKRIIRSDLVVGSANNDINTQKGLWQLIVNPYWQVTTGAPYILMSSEANKEMRGNAFFDRIPLTLIEKVDVDTHNFEQSGRTRFSAGFFDWRHVLMGGATTGTTLTT